MDSEPAELISFLLPYPEHVQTLMLEGRAYLYDLLAPVSELHYDATSAVCAGFSYTNDLKGLFVNLAAYANHVTLVFAKGAALADPERRLKGEGNQMRHVRISGMETLKDPYLLGLIREAADYAVRAKEPYEPKRVIKIYEGVKRRPTG